MRRIILIVVGVLVPLSASGQSSGPTVLFVCEHGAAKSVVAAAHFNKIAAERGLALRAIARGTQPGASIPHAIRDGLRAEQVPFDAASTPRGVSDADLRNAARVVTFDVSVTIPAGAQAPVAQWDGLPAFSDGYARASAAIGAKVEALARELAAPAHRQDVAVLAVSGMR